MALLYVATYSNDSLSSVGRIFRCSFVLSIHPVIPQITCENECKFGTWFITFLTNYLKCSCTYIYTFLDPILHKSEIFIYGWLYFFKFENSFSDDWHIWMYIGPSFLSNYTKFVFFVQKDEFSSFRRFYSWLYSSFDTEADTPPFSDLCDRSLVPQN